MVILIKWFPYGCQDYQPGMSFFFLDQKWMNYVSSIILNGMPITYFFWRVAHPRSFLLRFYTNFRVYIESSREEKTFLHHRTEHGSFWVAQFLWVWGRCCHFHESFSPPPKITPQRERTRWNQQQRGGISVAVRELPAKIRVLIHTHTRLRQTSKDLFELTLFEKRSACSSYSVGPVELRKL